MSRLAMSFTLFLSILYSILHADDPKSEERFGTSPPGKSTIYKHSADKPREMEIYFPEDHDPTKSKVPGLILFHGGAWGGGSLSQFRTACHYFARRGLVCATVNYRMLNKAETASLPVGETRKRVCITDAKSAIRWFKQNANELGIDPKRVITGGGSAGGHICVLATTNPGLNDPADSKDVDTSVAAYLLFNPAFALDDVKDAEVDVCKYLTKEMAPAIVFFGTDDSWKKGWDIAYEKLNLLGNTQIDVRIGDGQKHGFFNDEPWKTVTLIAADRFLVKQGLLTGEPTLLLPATGEKLVP